MADSDFKARRENLSEQVAELLQRYIVENRLRPGDPLPPELELAKIFGVSRAVIRESLRNAATLGVIDAQSGRRPVVRQPSGDVLRSFFTATLRLDQSVVIELLGVREALEAHAVRSAARNHTQEDLERLQTLERTMAESVYQHDKSTFVEADVEFHTRIGEMSDNATLGSLVQGLRDAMKESITLGLEARRMRSDLDRINRTHAAIVEAIAERNPDLAAQAMQEHFQEAVTNLLSNRRDSGGER